MGRGGGAIALLAKGMEVFLLFCALPTTSLPATPQPPLSLQVSVCSASSLSSGLRQTPRARNLPFLTHAHVHTCTRGALVLGLLRTVEERERDANPRSIFLLTFRKSSLPLVLFVSVQVNDPWGGGRGAENS